VDPLQIYTTTSIYFVDTTSKPNDRDRFREVKDEPCDDAHEDPYGDADVVVLLLGRLFDATKPAQRPDRDQPTQDGADGQVHPVLLRAIPGHT